MKITFFFVSRGWTDFPSILDGFWDPKAMICYHFPDFFEVNFETYFRRGKNLQKITQNGGPPANSATGACKFGPSGGPCGPGKQSLGASRACQNLDFEFAYVFWKRL